MGTLSPIITDAFHLLRTDLYAHLETGDLLAGKVEDWTHEDIEVARRLIPDLTGVITGLLADHQGTTVGDCRACQAAWPCSVVTKIHEQVKDPNREFVAIVSRAFEDE